jgi:nitroreductase
MLHKIIHTLFPKLPSTLNIFRSYLFEALRFARLNTNNSYRLLKTKHRAILTRKCHGVEKAFSLPNMKEKFGFKQAKVLLEELYSYSSKYGAENIVLDGLIILNNYFQYHKDINENQMRQLQISFEALMKILLIEKNEVDVDCFRPFKKQKEIDSSKFDAFFLSRYSVRKFSDDVIPFEKILHLAEISGKTPSACNRQPWNIRIIQTSELIEKALGLQNGNRGFSHVVKNLVIITGKVSCFSSKERNQVYIDCGMYSMSFIMALHANGIACCPLNMSYQSGDEKKVSAELKFDEDEVPIMMIAFGIAASDALCANSERQEASEFIQLDI